MQPIDHDKRMQRALVSLDGLSLGDGFGQKFFGMPEKVEWVIQERDVPRAPWFYTDDTEMAISIVNILREHARIDQDTLAAAFGKRYMLRPTRGYGGTAHDILSSIANGIHWTKAAANAFSGMGSMGNGGAMRVAPVGAYFADDFNKVAEQSRMSAEVTHAHAEGQAGAIAVAVAAAYACGIRDGSRSTHAKDFFDCALSYTPAGETRIGIEKASGLALDLSVQTAAGFLGNGSRVISQDTVPFTLWCAARHFNNFENAMWTTVAGLGDRDTTCAIVGGIVALSAQSIPSDWLAARESLQL
jgi:ADP-ribosylglycohydrolase